MLGLTKRETDMVYAIHDLTIRNGHAPSYDELASVIGLVKSNVSRILDQLERKGAIHPRPIGTARADSLTDSIKQKRDINARSIATEYLFYRIREQDWTVKDVLNDLNLETPDDLKIEKVIDLLATEWLGMRKLI